MDIKDLRNEIDNIDSEILKSFEKRMQIVREVADYKLKNDLPVFDKKRELELLNEKMEKLSDKTLRPYAMGFFQNIMAVSKAQQRKFLFENQSQTKLIQSNGIVAFQGINGSYSHEAALNIFSNDAKTMNFQTFEDVVNAVLDGKCEYGILPIENSSVGSVYLVYDLLGNSHVHIVDEYVLPIRHCLLGLGQLSDIKTVCSHNQALSQCEQYIKSKGFNIKEISNTAIAAKDVAKLGDKTVAAISSINCAKEYGLNILEENIADDINNFTRFIVISRKPLDSGMFKRVFLTFDIAHERGSLYNALSKLRNLNMTKIESRPKGDFEYTFYIDFSGEISDIGLNELIKDLKSVTKNIKLLGAVK